MKEKSLVEFTDILSAGVPVPGGGGAAALVGALSSSLSLMVLNYCNGKKKYADKDEEIKSLLSRVEEIRLEFLNLIEEDAKAFEPLAHAYGISKDDPHRGDLLEAATLSAIEPPFSMVRHALELSELIYRVYSLGNKMLNSDAACSACLCKASAECAAVNVFVNTSTLIDKDAAKNLNEEVKKALVSIGDICDRIYNDYLKEKGV